MIDIVAVISLNILIAITFQDYLSQLFFFFHLCTEMSVSTQTGCFVNIHFTKIETIHYIFYDALSYSYHPETKGVSHELVDLCQAQGLLVYV